MGDRARFVTADITVLHEARTLADIDLNGWHDVLGWLTPEEGRALQELARGKVVLELGSYAGRSTVCMALTAEHVVSVDWHCGDAGTGPADTLAEFLTTLRVYDVAGKVTPILGRFEAIGPYLKTAGFDLVFVDGQHDKESTILATRIARQCVKPGGVIAWHDFNYLSVQEAITACDLRPQAREHNLAWIRI